MDKMAALGHRFNPKDSPQTGGNLGPKVSLIKRLSTSTDDSRKLDDDYAKENKLGKTCKEYLRAETLSITAMPYASLRSHPLIPVPISTDSGPH